MMRTSTHVSDVSHESMLNLLRLVPPHLRWIVLLSLVVVVFVMVLWIVVVLAKGLKPRPIALEFARTRATATEILQGWGLLRGNARRVVVANFFLIPSYVALSLYVCFLAASSLGSYPVAWLVARIGELLGWFAVGAGLLHILENGALLRTLRRGPTDGLVAVTKFCARVKYVILAVVGAFLVFRFEYFVYELTETKIQYFPFWISMLLLTVLTFVLGIHCLREGRTLHPPLPQLQLARTPEAANRVLQRWGPDQIEVAARSNLAEMPFALAYAVTLGVVAFRFSASLSRVFATSGSFVLSFGPRWLAPLLNAAGRGVAWFLLLAGTLHLVQNIATYFVIRDKKATYKVRAEDDSDNQREDDPDNRRWWVALSRWSGMPRLFLLGLGLVWLFILFLHWEFGKVSDFRVRNWPGVGVSVPHR
jgi:hypothetical protein